MKKFDLSRFGVLFQSGYVVAMLIAFIMLFSLTAAHALSFSTPENTPITYTFNSSDYSNYDPGGTFGIYCDNFCDTGTIPTAQGGTADMDGGYPDTIQYTPPHGFTGTDTVTFYSTTDGVIGVARQATVTVTGSAPTVTALSPTAGSAGGGTSVTVTGNNFISPSSVHFGATNASFTVNSSTQITATAPGGNGTVDVTVTTGSGTSATNASDQFTYETIVLSPTTFPNGTENLSYLQTISASGGTAPYTFALTSGAPPVGLSLTSNGILSGVTTALGTFNFTVTATDASSITASRAYSISINTPALSNAPTTLPAPTDGASYSQFFSTSGGVAPYTFAISSGTLPAGLSLSSSGSLSGTPVTAGTFNFTVTATDAISLYTGSRAYTISVDTPIISITPTTLPAAGEGSAYAQILATSGGTAPYTYAITSGALPSGLSFNNATATLSGTPAAPGIFNFTVTASDSSTGSGPYTGSRSYSFIVNEPTITVSPSTIPSGMVATAYSQTITASGATAPYSYSISAGALPSGISLSSSGVLSGTPTAAGSFNIAVTATDSSTGTGAPFTGTVSYTLSISAPTIAISPSSLSSGQEFAAYNQAISVTGGTAPYTYTISSGVLPAGLSFNSITGVLSGTPSTDGTFNFTVRATDSSTGTGAPFSVSRFYTLTIIPPTVSVSPSTLPSGTDGAAYSQTITASGATSPYSYSITSGVLPSGLSLSSTGVLSGTPTSAGTFNLSVTATDSSSGPGAPFSAAKSYTLSIGAPVILITPTTLPIGQQLAAYSQTVTATGGIAPYTYTLSSGALPSGLSLSSAGVISGSPSTNGTFNFTISAMDSSTGTGAPFSTLRAYSLIIGVPTIIVGPPSISSGTVATAYSQSISASGATSPYTFTISAGALPAGISLSSSGALSGVPTAGGIFNFTVTATDSSTGIGTPFTQTKVYTLTVGAPILAITPLSSSSGQQLSVYSQSGTASGGTAPYTYSVTTGVLPSGLSLNSATGAISGTPTTNGSFNFTVTAQDSSTGTGPYLVSRSYTLIIGAPTIAIGPSALSTGTVAVAFSQTVSASGGTSPYTYAISVGALPSGITLSSSGILAGTPSAGGTFNFTVTATDSSIGTGAPFVQSKAYTLTISPAQLTLTPTALPTGQRLTAYSQTVISGGGTAPYSDAVTAGTLPTGLALTGAGLLSGTPTTIGTFNFTVTSSDSSSGTGPYHLVHNFSLTIGGPAAPVAIADAATTPANQAVVIQSGANDTGQITSLIVTAAPAHGTAQVNAMAITYTPAANYFGTDTFAYSAVGPGGTSTPVTDTIIVTPLAPPVAPPVTAVDSNGISAGKSITIHIAPSGVTISSATPTVHGDDTIPAYTVNITTPPAHGTAVVSGDDIVYTPAPGFSGVDPFGYSITNVFGTSAPASITVTVSLPPVAKSFTVTTAALTPVTVDITAGASGGPFVSAQIVSLNPSTSGTATVGATGQAGHFAITFDPAAKFSGQAVVSFTLLNQLAMSAVSTLTITVQPRPDPTLDPDVKGLIAAEGEAARRFAETQIENFDRRLEQLHEDGDGYGAKSEMGLSIDVGGQNMNPLLHPTSNTGVEPHTSQISAQSSRVSHNAALITSGSENAATSQTQVAAPAKRQTTRQTGVAVWTSGTIELGHAEGITGQTGNKFQSNGLSVGIDKGVTKHLALGIGAGFGHTRDTVGDDGTRSIAGNRVVAAYGSYSPVSNFYLDGVVGAGDLSFDTERKTVGSTVTGSRTGKEAFGSLTAAWEYHDGHLHLSPYGRFDSADTELGSSTEAGDPIWALAYGKENVRLLKGSLGVQGDYLCKERWGGISPSFRIEYGHDFNGSETSTVRYADLLNGETYNLSPDLLTSDNLLIGLGCEFRLKSGWKFALDWQDTSISNQESSSEYGLKISKQL